MTGKIEVAAAPTVSGSRYPAPYHEPCLGRFRHRLGDAAGLSQFGVNLTRLAPGAWSSQRHWHTAEDEFIYVVEGELVLITDAGEEILHVGDCAGFKAGSADGHHLQNRTLRDACFLEVGARRPTQDEVNYPDIDLQALPNRQGYSHRNGEPYPDAKPRNPAIDS
ncbi:MAG TPA: cupin domain-containing protein [Steroidobacteraceae bacterium]|nr:cupin domain-containing protein [Steroidobacteraceae bacterium]